MAVKTVYHTDSCKVCWNDETDLVEIDGSGICEAKEIDDLIEALQRIKADLARAKGGAAS